MLHKFFCLSAKIKPGTGLLIIFIYSTNIGTNNIFKQGKGKKSRHKNNNRTFLESIHIEDQFYMWKAISLIEVLDIALLQSIKCSIHIDNF